MKKYRLLLAIAIALFLGFGAFWAYLAVNNLQGDTSKSEFFSAIYGIMALYGGIVGLFASRRWGGHRSLVGRAIVFISLGLIAQEFGQVAYSMYTYLLHQEIPYPSLGDAGYFGSVIFYILAVRSLIKATRVKGSHTSTKAKALFIVIPVLLLGISYVIFLRDYKFDFGHPLSVILDFGYPLGQAFYISLAALAYLLSKKYLGGVMRPVVLLTLFALILQYSSDFVFLYQTNRNTWKTGGFNEFMYLFSYFVMTLALIKFGHALSKITDSLTPTLANATIEQPEASNDTSPTSEQPAAEPLAGPSDLETQSPALTDENSGTASEKGEEK
jgi:hypothetical protein